MVSAPMWASIGDHGVLNAQLPAGVSDLWIDRDLSWLDFNALARYWPVLLSVAGAALLRGSLQRRGNGGHVRF